MFLIVFRGKLLKIEIKEANELIKSSKPWNGYKANYFFNKI